MDNSSIYYKICTIDEAGRILLPAVLRQQLGWEVGDTLTVHVNLMHKFLEMIKQEFGELQVDKLGRIQFAEEFRRTMGWNATDKIFVKLNVEASSVSLALDSKSVPALKLNG